MARRMNGRLLLKVIKNEQEGATLRQIKAKMKRTLGWSMDVPDHQAMEIIAPQVQFGHVQVVQARGKKATRYQITAWGRQWLEDHPWSA